jgi:hypothetical protein
VLGGCGVAGSLPLVEMMLKAVGVLDCITVPAGKLPDEVLVLRGRPAEAPPA